MKTYKNIWLQVIDFENLLEGYRKAAKHKRYNDDVLLFQENLEENLITLQNELIWNMYRPQPPTTFYVNIPKRRLITAPAFRDRVVHHAICQVIEPLIDNKFIYDNFACRTGKGNHRAVFRLQELEQKAYAKWGSYHAVKGDIKAFFPSIPHELLKRRIRRVIGDKKLLELLDMIIDSHGPKGLPIGSLTSQLFANLYLDSLDHFAKETLQIKYWVRYMDDFVALAPTAYEARAVMSAISDFVVDELGLEMNRKSCIVKWSCGVPFCGFRVWPSYILPAKPAFKRAVRRLRKMSRLYREEKIPLERARASLMSFLGHYKHCNAGRSVTSVMNKIVFKGGGRDNI